MKFDNSYFQRVAQHDTSTRDLNALNSGLESLDQLEDSIPRYLSFDDTHYDNNITSSRNMNPSNNNNNTNNTNSTPRMDDLSSRWTATAEATSTTPLSSSVVVDESNTSWPSTPSATPSATPSSSFRPSLTSTSPLLGLANTSTTSTNNGSTMLMTREDTSNSNTSNREDEKDLLWLPIDQALIECPEFRRYVHIYANDQSRFFRDYSAAHKKMSECGCKFKENVLLSL